MKAYCPKCGSHDLRSVEISEVWGDLAEDGWERNDEGRLVCGVECFENGDYETEGYVCADCQEKFDQPELVPPVAAPLVNALRDCLVAFRDLRNGYEERHLHENPKLIEERASALLTSYLGEGWDK